MCLPHLPHIPHYIPRFTQNLYVGNLIFLVVSVNHIWFSKMPFKKRLCAYKFLTNSGINTKWLKKLTETHK